MKAILGNHSSSSKSFQGVTPEAKRAAQAPKEYGEQELLEEFTKTLDKIAARLNQDLGQDYAAWLQAGHQQSPAGAELRIMESAARVQGEVEKSKEVETEKVKGEESNPSEAVEVKSGDKPKTSPEETKVKVVEKDQKENKAAQGEETKQTAKDGEVSEKVSAKIVSTPVKEVIEKAIKQDESEVSEEVLQQLASESEVPQEVVEEVVEEGSPKQVKSESQSPKVTSEAKKVEDEVSASVAQQSEVETTQNLAQSNVTSKPTLATEINNSVAEIISKLRQDSTKTTNVDLLQQALQLMAQEFNRPMINNPISLLAQNLISKSNEGMGIKQVSNSSNSSPFQHSNSGTWGGSAQVKERSESQRLVAEKALNPRVPLKNFERVESVLKEAAKARDGRTISLRLDPPSLGSVKIDVSLKDGALHARLTAEAGSVTILLREKAHELQQTLRKLGLNVERITVAVCGENSFELVADSGGGYYSKDARGQSESEGSDTQDGDFEDGAASVAIGEVAKEQVLNHWIA